MVFGLRDPKLEVRFERFGDFVLDEVTESSAVDPSDYLAHEVAETQGMVSGQRPRLPPRRLRCKE